MEYLDAKYPIILLRQSYLVNYINKPEFCGRLDRHFSMLQCDVIHLEYICGQVFDHLFRIKLLVAKYQNYLVMVVNI